MIVKKFVVFLFLFLIAITSNVFSQGGSNYSLFGFGDERVSTGATYDARSGTSIAVKSDHGINLANPALLGYGEFTRMQVGFRFNQHLNIPKSGEAVAQFNSKLDGFSALFMLDTAKKAAFSIGIFPSTSVNYKTSSTFNDTVGSVPFKGKTFFEGSGGITNAYIAGSYSPFTNFTIGGSVAALLGNSVRSVQSVLVGENLFSSSSRIEDVYRGSSAKLGVIFTGIPNLTIGAVYTIQPQVSMTSTIRYSYFLLPDTTFRTISQETSPNSFALGFSYDLGDFSVASDFEHSDYSSVKYRKTEGVTFGSMQRFSASFSKNRSRRFSVPYSEKIGYHLGAGYISHYVNINGSQLSEQFASLGMDIPFGDAIFDVAGVFGTRGTTNDTSTRELFARFTFTLSIGETWFQPFKREQY